MNILKYKEEMSELKQEFEPKWFRHLVEAKDRETWLLKEITPVKGNIIIRRSTPMKGDWVLEQFGVFPDWKILHNYVTRHPAGSLSMFEIIPGDWEQKPKFDIDIKPSEHKMTRDEADTLIHHLEDAIRYHSFAGLTDIMVCTSHGPDKLSYHVIPVNVKVKNVAEAGKFFRMVTSSIPGRIKGIDRIDASVYKPNQHFRLIGTSKPEAGRPKIVEGCEGVPLTDEMLESSLISHCRYHSGECKLLELPPEEVKRVFSTPAFAITDEEKVINKSFEHYQHMLKDDTFDIDTHVMDNGSIVVKLKRSNPSMCNVCGRVHDNDHAFLRVSPVQKNLYTIKFFCRRAVDDKKYGRWSGATNISIGTIDVNPPPPSEIFDDDGPSLSLEQVVKTVQDAQPVQMSVSVDIKTPLADSRPPSRMSIVSDSGSARSVIPTMGTPLPKEDLPHDPTTRPSTSEDKRSARWTGYYFEEDMKEKKWAASGIMEYICWNDGAYLGVPCKIWYAEMKGTESFGPVLAAIGYKAMSKAQKDDLHDKGIVRTCVAHPNDFDEWIKGAGKEFHSDQSCAKRQKGLGGGRPKKVVIDSNIEAPKYVDKNEYVIANELLSMIDAKCPLWKWLDIARALYSEFGHNVYLEGDRKGQPVGLSMWKDFTIRSEDKRRDQACERNWNIISENDSFLTRRTLMWYAMKDNPNQYQVWLSTWLLGCPDENCSADELAEMVFRSAYIVYAHVRPYEWCIFSDGKWNTGAIRQDQMPERIKNSLSPYLRQLQCYYEPRLRTLDGKALTHLKGKIALLGKAIEKVDNNVSFRKKIMECLKGKYSMVYKTPMNELLDKNRMLTCFNNGVMEVVDHRLRVDAKEPCIYFREPKPEDYVRRSTKRNFNTNLTLESECVKKANRYLDLMFTDSSVRRSILLFMASRLMGGNLEKLFLFMIGLTGDNSKSAFFALLGKILGDYAIEINMSVFTYRSKTSNEPNAQEAEMSGTRFAYASETEGGELLNTSKLKSLAGVSDKGKIRKPYDRDTEDCDKSFIPAIGANTFVEVTSDDQALRNRVLVVFTESRWIANAPLDPDEQMRTRTFKANLNFESEELPPIAEGLTWLMFHAFDEWYIGGPRAWICPTMEEWKKAYWERADGILRFKTERLENGNNWEALKLDVILTELNKYWHLREKGKKMPNKEMIMRSLDTYLGTHVEEGAFIGWRGWRLRASANQGISNKGHYDAKEGKWVEKQ